MFASGVNVCRGEVIAFLNDDDCWEPGKLAFVAHQFDRDHDLAYVKHGHSYINAEGQPLSRYRRRFFDERSDRRTLPLSFSLDDLGSRPTLLRHAEPDFNDSTISIRRDVLVRFSGHLRRISTNEDSFFFYAALASHRNLLISDNPLAQYRIHSENLTAFDGRSPSFWARRRSFGASHLSTIGILKDMCLGAGAMPALRYLDREEAYFRLLITTCNASALDRKLGKNLLGFLPHALGYKRKTNLGLIGLALVNLVSLGLARELYLHAQTF